MTAYPALFVDLDGDWGAILPGHDVDADRLADAMREVLGASKPGRVEQVLWSEQPRVKWCERYGPPCDMNGDWHAHWHEVAPECARAEHRFTVIYEKGAA